MGVEELDRKLEAVYEAGGDRATLDRLYDDWAKEYDSDLWGSGNPHIAIAVGMVGRHVPDRQALILDAGCGTGIMGEMLSHLGYERVEGLDASRGMLDVAARKGCYTALHQKLLGAEIELPEIAYDAINASGVLTHGHAPPESLDGMLSIAKPGAPIIFSISKIAVEEGGFGDKMAALEAAGRWSPVDRSRAFRTYPFSDDMAHLRHWICVYRKSS